MHADHCYTNQLLFFNEPRTLQLQIWPSHHIFFSALWHCHITFSCSILETGGKPSTRFPPEKLEHRKTQTQRSLTTANVNTEWLTWKSWKNLKIIQKYQKAILFFYPRNQKWISTWDGFKKWNLGFVIDFCIKNIFGGSIERKFMIHDVAYHKKHIFRPPNIDTETGRWTVNLVSARKAGAEEDERKLRETDRKSVV